MPLALDVADEDSRRAAVEACTHRFGGVDVLVNCAGVLRDARVEQVDPAVFRRLLAINLLGPLALTRLVAPGMAGRGGGAIVNIASRAWLGTFGSTAYSTAKGGLVGATRSLALELGREGITVNAVAPGFVATPMTDGVPEKVRLRTLEAIPSDAPARPTTSPRRSPSSPTRRTSPVRSSSSAEDAASATPTAARHDTSGADDDRITARDEGRGVRRAGPGPVRRDAVGGCGSRCRPRGPAPSGGGRRRNALRRTAAPVATGPQDRGGLATARSLVRPPTC